MAMYEWYMANVRVVQHPCTIRTYIMYQIVFALPYPTEHKE